jgi:hypothetical protein
VARKASTQTAKAAPGKSVSGGNSNGKVAGTSSEAVEKATGRGWDQWLAILDKAGARTMVHKDIARLLHEEHGLSGWWAQSVTVGYEQARGLRQKHETSEGFQISASKTIGAPIGKAFSAWNDVKSRQAWLGDAALQIRKATADKSIRITWEQGPEKGTSVEVYLYAKGQDKCQVAVNHTKLRSAAAGEKMKKY